MTDLLSVSDAKNRMVSVFSPVSKDFVDLSQSRSMVLAENVTAEIDLPPFANSSMDGFAVRSEDTLGAKPQNPISLPVVMDIPAGMIPPGILQPGQSARIMTGAMIPEGSDAIVPVESTTSTRSHMGSRAPSTVEIIQPAQPGDYIRPQGQDLKKGQTVLPAHHTLQPVDIGLLASLGFSKVNVFRKPRIALLSSGDELISPDQPLAPGKIRDSNSYTLAALIEQFGGTVVPLGVARDDPQDVSNRLNQAVSAGVDLILTSAGVSVGAFDYVRSVIETNGELSFWRVNMRPGKPVAFGSYNNIPLIGLPGNPVSAFVAFIVFTVPVLRRLAGLLDASLPTLRVTLAQNIQSDGRESYLRAVLKRDNGRWMANLAGHQGSGNLFGLTLANALLIVPPGVKSLSPGAELDAWLLHTE